MLPVKPKGIAYGSQTIHLESSSPDIPLMTSYNPSIFLLESFSLQKRIIGSISSLDPGIPCFRALSLTSATDAKPFLNDARASGRRASSDGLGRWATSTGVGEGTEGVGCERRGPEMETTEPSDVGGAAAADDAIADRWAWSCSFHRRMANSEATLPPWAKPNRWMRSRGQARSVVRWSTTFDKRSKAGVGLGLGRSSPRGSQVSYHWYASS